MWLRASTPFSSGSTITKRPARWGGVGDAGRDGITTGWGGGIASLGVLVFKF